MLGNIYWTFISRIKNYYNGYKNSKIEKQEVLRKKFLWLTNYVSISDDSNTLHKKDVPDLKRGNIILVELGDNLGMEFGGKHHCVVLRDCPSSQDQVFVLPITSKKPKKFNPHYNGIYIEFNKIRGFNGYKHATDPHHKDNGKHWANILSVRNISKSRVYYPTKIRNVPESDLNKISNCVIANIALRRDLLMK